MIRATGISALVALTAACAAPQAQRASVQADPYAATVTTLEEGVIEVAAFLPAKDALAHLHCAAGAHARAAGATMVEWVGGVSQHTVTGDKALLVYHIYALGEAEARPGSVTAEDGGVMPLANWLAYCDRPGGLAEGEA